MPQLDREQTIAVGAVALMLALCLFALSLAFQQRSGALQDAIERREALARLEARLSAEARRAGGAAPPTAFVEAPTPGLAGARLQSYLAQVAGSQNAVVVSTAIEPARKGDAESIRLQATVDLGLGALQALLHRLETGTPYVFVESLVVQLPGGAGQRPAQDPLLRGTLVLRALWRKGAA